MKMRNYINTFSSMLKYLFYVKIYVLGENAFFTISESKFRKKSP